MRPDFVSEEMLQIMQEKVSKGRAGAILPCADSSPACEGMTTHRSTSPYKSKWEAAYANKLELDKQAGYIKAYWHEPFSLWLPGKVRYKPDFMIQYPNGMERMVEIVEVKGWSRNRRDGMTRLKIAAALFPCFTWRLVKRTKGGGWDAEYIA